MSEQPAPSTTPSFPPPSAWVGWIAFAAAIMVLLGSLHIFQGFVALFRDTYAIVLDEGVITVDHTAWGIVHILGGLIILAAGFGVLQGKIWARTVGVIMAMISAILNVAMMEAFPIWSLTMVALDIVIILALTVHGREITPEG